MTLLQMKCFISLAATKKLTETANLFGLGVSSLSKYIDHMEDELSTKLFQKTQNGLQLTKEGEIIYPSFQFIVKKYDDLLLHMDTITKKHCATVNVAIVFHQKQILSLLSDFQINNPDIQLTITENMASHIQSMLNTSSIDVAIIYEELLEKKYPHAFPLRKDKLVAIVGHGHPLAARECISVSELKNETLFLFKGDILMYHFLLHICIAAGFAPAVSDSDLRVQTIMEYVASNYGVSLLIENSVKCLKNENIKVLQLIENPTLTMSIFLPAAYLPDTCGKLVEALKNNA